MLKATIATISPAQTKPRIVAMTLLRFFAKIINAANATTQKQIRIIVITVIVGSPLNKISCQPFQVAVYIITNERPKKYKSIKNMFKCDILFSYPFSSTTSVSVLQLILP